MLHSDELAVLAYTVETAPPLTKNLIKHLKSLDHDEIRILWVFAVIYVPVNQGVIKDVLSYLNWELEAGGRMSPLMAKALREKLLEKKLLEMLSGGYICNRLIVELIARQAQTAGCYRQVAKAARVYVPYKNISHYDYSRHARYHTVRKIRDALYESDDQGILHQISPHSRYNNRVVHNFHVDLYELCMKPFDEKWFSELPTSIQSLVLDYRVSSREFPRTSPDYEYLNKLWETDSLHDPDLTFIFLEWRLEKLQLSNIESLFEGFDCWRKNLMQAWLLSLKGRYEEAVPLFLQSQKLARKKFKDTKFCFTGLPGLYYCLSLLSCSGAKFNKELEKQLKAISRMHERNPLGSCFDIIESVRLSFSGEGSRSQKAFFQLEHNFPVKEMDLFFVLAKHWLGEAPPETMLNTLAKHSVIENDRGSFWFVQQSLDLLRHYNVINTNIKGYQDLLDDYKNASGIASLVDLVKPQASWQRALQALKNLDPNSSDSQNSVDAVQQTRIVWFISGDFLELDFQPKEQKLTKTGGWTKGRNIALRRLFKSLDSPNTLSEWDVKICRCIEKEYDYYGSHYSLSSQRALYAAVGHPSLFWAVKPDKPVELLSGDVELIVQQKKENLAIRLHPEMDSENFEYGVDYLLQKEGAYRLRLFKFSAQHQEISRILGGSGLIVPTNAKQEVLDSLQAISPLLSIQSDIGGGSLDARQVNPDSQLYMQVQPQKNSFIFNLSVQPLGQNGPQFIPGDGRANIMFEVEGERLHASRNLALEETQYQVLLKDIPLLQQTSWDEHECEWHMSGEEALQALYELQAYGDPLTLLWPKGGQLKFNRESTLKDMSASVRYSGDWFTLEGGLTLDDGQVIEMAKLLNIMKDSPGRFIRLSDDSFLTLTKQLTQRLVSLSRQGGQQYHPLAVTALEELTDGMVLQGDKQWKDQKARIQKAYSLRPSKPKTLQAELRDYQYEGFVWLSRLAHWGAGACLADDMGLGKTIQALALILSRAKSGPTLILAPTSVCMNWIQEALRFTPTLKVIRFGGKDRESIIDKAGPYDLIVCSYGLLQTEVERLQKVRWQTIVADEAQALKNTQTKRARAANSLNGVFKIATTGTPIENHLGELWALFHFINPGLLGTLNEFNRKFTDPIENDQDAQSRQHLKRLVQPFILRRLKTDVLTELPSRTEITISIPPSKEETIFYEALRRKAMESLSANKHDKPGEKRLKMLAEIMKLRRACCNPRLVIADSHIPSSKLIAFGEIVTELRENNHRALVFSQFVGHLELIKEFLDERAVSYQYLDGSTPVKKREKAVNDFQSGEGDLFLISLKAGGSGLNLTAADYVVHMDPWWNPAVEDQASDRAHRLGQKRPVTIYRLVAENTIEQKIIALHEKKRDLADSLLEGSDVSGKLSAEEIMNLIDERG